MPFMSQVRGIKFYPGYADFRSTTARCDFLHVDLVREKHNPYDTNAVLVVTRSPTPKVLGQLKKEVTAAVAKIINLKLPYTHLRRYIIITISSGLLLTINTAVLAYLGRNIPLVQQLLMAIATNIVQQVYLPLCKDRGCCALTYVT